jgi:hypothetical protein
MRFLDSLPQIPNNGRCVCGRVPFFVRSGLIGQPGHFWCRRCGGRYRFATIPWSPSPGEGVAGLANSFANPGRPD